MNHHGWEGRLVWAKHCLRWLGRTHFPLPQGTPLPLMLYFQHTHDWVCTAGSGEDGGWCWKWPAGWEPSKSVITHTSRGEHPHHHLIQASHGAQVYLGQPGVLEAQGSSEVGLAGWVPTGRGSDYATQRSSWKPLPSADDFSRPAVTAAQHEVSNLLLFFWTHKWNSFFTPPPGHAKHGPTRHWVLPGTKCDETWKEVSRPQVCLEVGKTQRSIFSDVVLSTGFRLRQCLH